MRLEMETEGVNKSLRTIKIIQVLLILAVLIYLDILVRFPVPPPFETSGNTFRLIIAVLAILGAGSLAYSYFMPKLTIKGYKSYRRKPRPNEKSQIFSIFLVRAAMLEAVAIYGLILGILGASLEIVAPFFIAALVCLLLTFPTKSKWGKLAGMIESSAGK
jgi:F0F1-type ATP synthase membrane subunit c/vacuolar-type H+-ATPase subunit K